MPVTDKENDRLFLSLLRQRNETNLVMKYTHLLGLCLAILVSGCLDQQISDEDILDQQLLAAISKTSPTASYQHYILPGDDQLTSLPNIDPANPITPDKIALGRMLFFETGFGLKPRYSELTGTYSCASCHVPSAGFTPGRFQGIADGGIGFGYSGEMRRKESQYGSTDVDAQGVRALSMFNTAFVTNTLWSGTFGSQDNNVGLEEAWRTDTIAYVNELGYKALETQNIENYVVHRMTINKQTITDLGYKELFDQAFPDLSEEQRYSPIGGSFALSSYLRSLITNQAPFQRYLRGEESAMNDQEKKGAMLFFTKANCTSCHNGPAFNANTFQAVGVKDLYEIDGSLNTGSADKRNRGRGGFTKDDRDNYRFKVPQLYNLRDANFYFHGSSKNTLREVVEYFNNGVAENPNVPADQLSTNFHPLNLTNQEIDDLTTFLKTALYDPEFTRFIPDQVMSGNCFPNNDLWSKQDIGCN